MHLNYSPPGSVPQPLIWTTRLWALSPPPETKSSTTEGPTQPMVPTNEQLLDQFDTYCGIGREGARPIPVLRPSLPVAGPEEQLPGAEQWLRDYEALPDNREVRYAYLETSLARLAETMHHAEDDQLLEGALSVALLCSKGYFKDGGRGYARPQSFLAAYFRPWHLGPTSVTRISRLASSARLWLELRRAGHPLPLRLSVLEDLTPKRRNGVKIYGDLVAKHGKPPTASQVTDYLVASGYLVNRTPELPRIKIMKLVDRAAKLVAEEPQKTEEIALLLAQIREVVAPKFKNRRSKAVTDPKPIYNATWGCPVELRVAERSLQVHVSGRLPEPQHATALTCAIEEGWTQVDYSPPEQESLNGSHTWVLNHDPRDPDDNAKAGKIFDMFEKMCRRVGAPEPVLINSLPA